MKKFIFGLMAVLMGYLSGQAAVLNDEIDGKIGDYAANIHYIMNTSNNTIKGDAVFKTTSAPIKGRINFTGSCRHVKDPEVPNYPLYKATMKSTNSSGQPCGSWDVMIDTRMGTITGTCKINGKSYNVSFDIMSY